MFKTIKAMAITVATAGLLASGATVAQAEVGDGAAGAEGTPAEAARDAGLSTRDVKAAEDRAESGKYYRTVWEKTDTYWIDFTPTNGYLNAGKNYFYCQGLGKELNYKGYKNKYWLLTDDDDGNTDVIVNAIFIKGGSDNEPVAGVPFC